MKARFFRRLWCGLALLPALALSTPVLAQCTDADGDGFFYESGCGTALDCNDADSGTYPGATETCDGYDNDCDGLTDNDPACDSSCDLPGKAGSDVLLGDAQRYAGTAVVWTGSEYGVAWAGDTRELYFARLDPSGNFIGQAVQVSSGVDVDAWWPSLVWTGTHFGVAWSDDRNYNDQVYFARLDASGNKLGDDVLVSSDPDYSYAQSLVWTGTEYGVAWEDHRHGPGEIYFARLDALGNKIGNEVRVTDVPSQSYEPSMVWNGTEYGMAWVDHRTGTDIYFARLDASGGKIGGDVLVTDPSANAYGRPSCGPAPATVWPGAIGVTEMGRFTSHDSTDRAAA